MIGAPSCGHSGNFLWGTIEKLYRFIRRNFVAFNEKWAFYVPVKEIRIF